jgi:hypothetical protein
MELAGGPRHPSELGDRYEGLQFVKVHFEPSAKLMRVREIMH